LRENMRSLFVSITFLIGFIVFSVDLYCELKYYL